MTDFLSHKHFLIKSEGSNSYFLNFYNKKGIIIPPLMVDYVKNLDKNISNTEEKSASNYYIDKINLLIESGYFSNNGDDNKLRSEYTAEDIISSFSNTNHIIIEVTEKCNLSCKYCGFGENYNYFNKRNGKSIDFEHLKVFFDFLIKQRFSSNNFNNDASITVAFYGGEPLLNFKTIEKTVNYLSEFRNRIKFKFDLITNGTLLQNKLDYFVSNRFNIFISLDGDKNHNEYRKFKNGEESFDIVKQLLVNIVENYPDFFSKNVHFISTLHNKNGNKAIRSYFHKEFNKTSIVLPLRIDGLKQNHKDNFIATFLNKDQEVLNDENYTSQNFDELIKDSNSELNRLNSFIFNEYSNILLGDKKEGMITGTCYPFRNKIYITANGDLLPCDKIDYKYALATIKSTHLDINFSRIANYYNVTFEKMLSMCSKCFRSINCSQCIFFINPENEIIKCDGFINKSEYKTISLNRINLLERSIISLKAEDTYK